jgi:MoaA/NifB/PqqE/SkfB family radical SAM enzyme
MDIYKDIYYLNKINYKNYLLYTKAGSPLFNMLPISLRCMVSEPLSRPIMLACETVNICTNSCIICPYEKMTRKKTTMSIELFEKVLHDYSAMGGGCLTLTPKSGEVFLDTLLEARLSLLDTYPRIQSLSVTTNAIPVERYSDSSLRTILNYFDKIQISIYGLDREEYSTMTRRDFYSRMIGNIQRILEILDGTRTEVLFGFRFLKNHSTKDVEDWIGMNFGMDIPYDHTYTYMDWNHVLDTTNIDLMDANWREKPDGDSHCLLPLLLSIVYSNGDVSYCPCIDFDISSEFNLGNIRDTPLGEILNSEKSKGLWKKLPEKCISCSSYRPIAKISDYPDLFKNPVKYVGA